MVKRGELIYEGKAKKVYKTDDPNVYYVYFKDDATAFNGLKKGQIKDKGCLNNQISTMFFELLQTKGVSNHFIAMDGDRGMLVRPLEIIPVEVVVRNIVAGSLAKRIGQEEGTRLDSPVLEFYYKNDALGDPMINSYHIKSIALASESEMSQIEKMALEINHILREYLVPRGIELIDFKLEFGRYGKGILLGDEISPDTCRFWDIKTQEKMDKDRFRRDLGGVEEAYQEILRRLKGVMK